MENKKSVFETLNAINVSDKIEKKNKLSFLSWAWAWAEVKKLYPEASYAIYEREAQYGPVNYFTDGHTCWVKTGVIIEGIEHIEHLPIMDYSNKSILLSNLTSFDTNKAIQRSLTKAIARHGLGLYIYAGEDLPEQETSQTIVSSKNEMPAVELLKEAMDLRRNLESLGADIRSASTVEFILKHTGLKQQDPAQLNATELNKLIVCYQSMIKAKEQQNASAN